MMSIRSRLLAGTAIGVALTFIVSSLVVYTLTRSQLYAQFDESLATRARALTALIEQEGDAIETDLGREEVTGEYHQLWQGTSVLRRSRSLGARDLTRGTTSASIVTIERVTLPDGRDGRQATLELQPHQDADEHPRATPITITFALARDVAEIEATISALRRVLILVGIAATLLALALLAAAVRFGLRPVRDLAAVIAKLRESDLAARLDAAQSPVELRPVVERLNELLGRLEAAFTRQRELTADVAHELRTPMAGLRATIEQVRSRERTPERYRGALDDCLAIVVQTERTVGALLSLARVDAGKEKVTTESVAIDELVAEVLAGHTARIEKRQLVVEHSTKATWITDRAKLRVVVENLIDNAVAYADDGGTITIDLTSDLLRVTNTGCRLAPDQVERVFERFWRGDQARSASGHAGVGLALSRKLVELLGGTLNAQVSDQRFVATIARTSELVVDRSQCDA